MHQQPSFPILAGVFLLMLAPFALAQGEALIETRITNYDFASGEGVRLSLSIFAYNMTDRDLQDVLVRDTFVDAVTVESSSVPPSRVGAAYVWALGTLAAQGVREIALQVRLTALEFSQPLDSGAVLTAAYYLTPVTAQAAPAVPLDLSGFEEYLQATLDADSEDPYVRRMAVGLGGQSEPIIRYVRDEVGFELYDGSLRGALGTLWSQAGNALDQASLLIALMRASRIPARYAQGFIPAASASQLIGSMFDSPGNFNGTVPPNVAVSDPQSDPALIAEATRHAWVEYWNGTTWTPVDPTLPGANLAAAPYIAPATTYSEISDSRRHKIRIRLSTQSVSTAFGGFPITERLNQVLRTVQTVGKPITVGHATNQIFQGSILGSTLTQRYRPFLAVGEEIYPAAAFDEIWGLGGIGALVETFLVAEWLYVELIHPNGQVETFERTLFDRNGYVARKTGNLLPLTYYQQNKPTQPSLSEMDFFTIYAPVGRVDPLISAKLQQDLVLLRQEADVLFPQVQDIPLDTQNPQEIELVKQANILMARLATQMTRVAGSHFLLRSQELQRRCARGFHVKAYSDSPNLLIARSVFDASQIVILIDARKSFERVIPWPGQAAFTDYLYRVARGRLEGAMEPVALREVSPATSEPILSTLAVFEAASQQGIPLKIVESVEQLDSLEISEEARLRITEALDAGRLVDVPVRMPQIDGRFVIAWWETDPLTGETYAVTEDGGHQALISYAGLLNGAHNKIIGAFIGTFVGGSNTIFTFLGEFFKAFNSTHDGMEAIRQAKIGVGKSTAVDCAGAISPGLGEVTDIVLNVRDVPSFAEYINRAVVRAVQAVLGVIAGDFATGFSIGQCIGEAATTAWLADLFQGDPAVPVHRIDTHAFDIFAQPTDSSQTRVTGISLGQNISGKVQSELFHADGRLAFSFSPLYSMGMIVKRLQAASGEVHNTSGQLVASGNVTLTSDAGAGVVLEQANAVALSGTGTLSSFPHFLSEGLAPGASWVVFDGTATGNVAFDYRGALRVGTTNVPSGHYRITADQAVFSGSGGMAVGLGLANVSFQSLDGILGVGQGRSGFSVGFFQIAAGEGISLATYSGSVSLAALDAASDEVQIGGTFGGHIALQVSPRTIEATNAAQFLFTLRPVSSLSGDAILTSVAPAHWETFFLQPTLARMIQPSDVETGSVAPRFFVESALIPGLVAQAKGSINISQLASGLALQLIYDPDRYIPVGSGHWPGVFEVRVQGLSPESVTVDLSASVNIDATAQLGVESVALSGIEPAYTDLQILPGVVLPAPGTLVEVSAVATDSEGASESANGSFTVPEIRAAAVKVDRANVFVVDSRPVEVGLSVRNSGNVAGNFTLDIQTPPGFSRIYQNPGPLAPGQIHNQMLSLGTSLSNASGVFLISTLVDGQPVSLIGVRLTHVSSLAALAAYTASESAWDNSLFHLSDRLKESGDSLLALEGNKNSLALRDAAINSIETTRMELTGEYVSFDPELGAISIRMASDTGQALNDELADLAEVLGRLDLALRGEGQEPSPTPTSTPFPTLTPTPPPAQGVDFDGNGVVDGRDLWLFSRVWNRTESEPDLPNYFEQADLFADGVIDADDLVRVIGQYRQ